MHIEFNEILTPNWLIHLLVAGYEQQKLSNPDHEAVFERLIGQLAIEQRKAEERARSDAPTTDLDASQIALSGISARTGPSLTQIIKNIAPSANPDGVLVIDKPGQSVKYQVFVRVQDGIEECGEFNTLDLALEEWARSTKALNNRKGWVSPLSAMVYTWKNGKLVQLAPKRKKDDRA